MMDLGEFLAQAGRRRRSAGEWDCCAFPAAWAIANGYPDPMAHWRGAYETESEALDLISDAGGLVALFDCGMASAGISRREGEPQAGDIGVIKIGDLEAGAIFTGRRWALVAERGVGMASVAPEAVAAVWSI